MDHTLSYLREILSSYSDKYSISSKIVEKIESHDFSSEGAFVRKLTEEEVQFLDQILPEAIEYAKQEADDKRADQLNEVYELLY